MDSIKYIPIGKFKIAVYVGGNTTGLPIVFIHGNSCNALLFKNQFEGELAGKYRLIAIDLPGHGLSSHSTEPEKDYNAIALGAVVAQVIDQLELSEVILAGHSLGVNIAAEAMTVLVAKVKAFVAISGSPIDPPPAFDKIFNPEPALAYFGTAELTEENIQAMYEMCSTNPLVFSYLKQSLAQTDKTFRSYIVETVLIDEVTLLKNVATPQLYVMGEHERLYTFDYLKNLGLPLWKDEIQVIPNAGHFPMIDNPIAFNELLLRFLKDSC